MEEIPWVWLVLRGTGLIAWVLLSLTVLWGILIRSRHITAGSPLHMFEMHKWFGALGLGFLIVHMIMVVLDPTIKFSVADVLIPGIAPWEPLAMAMGIIAFYLIIPASVIGRIRSRLGKAGNKLFKWSHWGAYAAWPLATAHYLIAGTDALTAWAIMLTVVMSASIIVALTARGWRPRGQLLPPR